MQAAASSVCVRPAAMQRPSAPTHSIQAFGQLNQLRSAPAAFSAGKPVGWSPVQRRGIQLRVHAVYGAEWSTPKDAYVTLGLAHCFQKSDEGKLEDRFLIEPITANGLECMANGAKTCYSHVFSLSLGEALQRSKAALPADFSAGIYCEGFEARANAAARTWMRPHAMDNLLDIVPLGQVKSSFNYSTDDKRVLNMDNVVNDDDNIKQDISIDVYGRQKAEEYAEQQEAAPAAEEEEEKEDELDALLA